MLIDAASVLVHRQSKIAVFSPIYKKKLFLLRKKKLFKKKEKTHQSDPHEFLT